MGLDMVVVGLTGGIGAGKTEVARVLAGVGIPVMDADAIAHRVIGVGGAAHGEVLETFGPGILGPGGDVDRKALGRIVFRDPVLLRRLEAIVHGKVLAEIERMARILELMGHRVAVVEAALLVETGLHEKMDAVVAVVARDDVRAERARARDGSSRHDVSARMSAQLDQDAKASKARWVLRNDSSLEDLRKAAVSLAVDIVEFACNGGGA